MTTDELLHSLKTGYYSDHFFKRGVEYPLEIEYIQSSKANAFASPGRFLDTGKVSVYDFFEELNEAQKRFILAHEISHIANKDYYKGKVIHYILLLSPLLPLFLMKERALEGALITFIFSLIFFFLYPSLKSRIIEKRADKDAVACSHPGDLPEIIALFEGKFRSRGGLTCSHPSSKTRIKYITRYFKEIHDL